MSDFPKDSTESFSDVTMISYSRRDLRLSNKISSPITIGPPPLTEIISDLPPLLRFFIDPVASIKSVHRFDTNMKLEGRREHLKLAYEICAKASKYVINVAAFLFWKHLIRIYLLYGSYANALKLVQFTADRFPNRVQNDSRYILNAILSFKTNDLLDEAIQKLEEILAIDGSSFFIRLLSPVTGNFQYKKSDLKIQLAITYSQVDRKDDCEKLMQEVVEGENVEKGEMLLKAAKTAKIHGDHPFAIDVLEYLLENTSKDTLDGFRGSVYLMLGSSFVSCGHFDDANDIAAKLEECNVPEDFEGNWEDHVENARSTWSISEKTK